MNRILRELIIRSFPVSSYRAAALHHKFVEGARYKGENVKLERNVAIIRRIGMAYGSHVLIEGSSMIDAQGGIVIGDRCIIKKGVNLSSYDPNDPEMPYKPIIIGSNNIINNNLEPGTILINKTDSKGFFDLDAEITFILGTGRSGSKAMSHLLSRNSTVLSLHDAFAPITVWAAEFMKFPSRKIEIKNKLIQLFQSLDFRQTQFLLLSNHKYSALIPVLIDIFPNSKFIWMLRKADSFVSSSYPRGWFSDQEMGRPKQDREFIDINAQPDAFNAYHRPKGFWVNEFEKDHWKSITAFERNCWYWAYWNKLIESHLKLVPQANQLKIKLERLDSNIPQLENFLNLSIPANKAARVNTATYKKVKPENWNSEMKAIYKKYCIEPMDKWYNSDL